MRSSKFRCGDRIVVRTPEEIFATLDAEGRLDGLPFMPEMLEWCGKSFQVFRHVEKTCMEVEPGFYPNRRFAMNDVFFLEGPRCDGSGHDGCHRGCRIFWKEAWFRSADDVPASHPAVQDVEAARARLNVKAAVDQYICQSTELFRATEAFPGKKKPWLVRLAFRELRNGELSAGLLSRLVFRWLRLKAWRIFVGHNSLRGPNTRTPSESLDLQPGERVRIRSRDAIIATLDSSGRNRGMALCEEMTRFCDREAEVKRRVDRIIDEKTGRMRSMHQTVMLDNLSGDSRACMECLCHGEVGDCPRGELMFWREIWLERAAATRQ